MNQFPNARCLAIEPINNLRRISGLFGVFRSLILKLHFRPAKLLGVQAFHCRILFLIGKQAAKRQGSKSTSLSKPF